MPPTPGDVHVNAPLTQISIAYLQGQERFVSARVFHQTPTTEIYTRYTNDKVYSISNAADFTPNDSFHRRVFSTNVAIQNIRSINMMSF